MTTKRRFGPFDIQARLGSGGMGIVYRAVYHKTGRTVALKILSPEVSGDDKILARFEREIEILKRLKHKHIVKYYGGGRIGNQNFYAMELMEGGALDDHLKKTGRLKWEQAVEVGKGVARALEHAHYHGIVHRDLKPANLFLSKAGLLKLGDFGIARDNQRTALTAAGRTVGTHAYMAPEQISGQAAITGKTDQYALGCVLFEILTGRPPFEAENSAQMLIQHLEIMPPKVRSLAPDCPVWLEGIIAKLLEKEPEDRYFDSLAVFNAIKEVPNKVAAGASVSRETLAGDATVASLRKDPELRKILKRKRTKKKRDFQPFYERGWFLATCLAALIALIAWAAWPISDEERFARGKALMERAAQLEDDDERAELYLEARDKYFDKLIERAPDGPHAEAVRGYLFEIKVDQVRRQTEIRIRGDRSPRSNAESLYMPARRAEQRGHRLTALQKYETMIRLLKDQEEARPYVELARRRIEAIYQDEPKAKPQELIARKLKEADSLADRGDLVAAKRIWTDIVGAFGENADVKPLVDKARAKLEPNE